MYQIRNATIAISLPANGHASTELSHAAPLNDNHILHWHAPQTNVAAYTLNTSQFNQPLYVIAKHALDIAVSATALIALSPVMLIIGMIVKRDGGPALYGHPRVGRNGKPFICWKFRSMVVNGDEVLEQHLSENPLAEHEWHTTRKLRNDPRITRIGNFLRKSSLDELPQLINVLRGDMSVVGPRPIVTDEIEHYGYSIKHYYCVRPGITGLWQVSGRNNISYPQRVQLDTSYVCNWSLWNDIAIMFKTIPALLKRKGAY